MNSVLRKQGMPGVLKTPSGATVCTSAEKADAFNRYFHSVFTDPVCPPVHPLPCPSSTPLISGLNVQHEEVRKELIRHSRVVLTTFQRDYLRKEHLR